ncbi:flavin-containing monooxygenase [Sphingomonas bacterium]|uniref:flavin-containing monooxygenase n=1 Tax=Sphingomonas bacterium TaxID=1895847 RepID=UPI001576CA89|nr:NAD(P)-binding domain-containing protein [Sphingomonas bacterium]
MTIHQTVSRTGGGPLVCVIGAGPSGIATIKRLKDYGIAYDCFEASDNAGGNWYFRNPNGMSACYQSLHIDTSKARFAFEDFPVPDKWPDYPHHSEIFAYLNAYLDNFDLRDTIIFNTKVTRAHREADTSWTVETSDGERRRYDILIVANGHHWDPRWPEPTYPGDFAGEQIHAHSYNTPFDPIDMRGKRVLVVGAGNSAMDIASELAQRSIAQSLTVSMRHGVWVFPKYRKGKPSDKAMMPSWVPEKVQRFFYESTFKSEVGAMESYGLPTPDHKPWQAHGSLSTEFLLRAGSGDLKAVSGIERFDGSTIHFKDGHSDEFDVIIWATGYKISFPFFDQPMFNADADNRPPPLFKRMLIPGVSNLIYMGLAQPLPTLVNFAEQQSKLAVAYIKGAYALPTETEMRSAIVADDTFYLSKYYRSPRHTIQLNFYHYKERLEKEIAAGIKRRRRGRAAAAFPNAVAATEAA